MFKVIMIGEICEDILMHNPSSIEVMGEKVWAEDITITTGGSASYASTALKHLGVDVKIYSVVGDDLAGYSMISFLRQKGIDCSGVKILPSKKSTKSMMVCDKNKKTFVGCSPMLPMYIPKIDDFGDFDLVYVAGYMLFPEFWTDEFYDLLCEVKKRGKIIALDGQMLPVDKFDPIASGRLDKIFQLIDVFFVAHKEVLQILNNTKTNNPGKLFLDMGCKTVVLKKGMAGCIVMTQEDCKKVDSFLVEAYDTVGSGDIFGASYCFSMLNGLEKKACAEFASVFTGLSLKKYDDYKIYPKLDTEIFRKKLVY